jgi:Fe2+ transport system protein B
VNRLLEPSIAFVDAYFPHLLRVILTQKQGEFAYGLLNMGPFLLVWALPTVILFSVILGIYKASGLVERINIALHPWVRHLGLSGRDVVRVLMGFGCNVPAVISTRACSQCSRNSAISAISFGAACSYQLPATLAVLSVAAQTTLYTATQLTFLFLGYLLITTTIFLWLTASASAKNSLNLLMTPPRPFMQWPTFSAIFREAWDSIRQFFLQALPVFALICMVASLLSYFGLLAMGSRLLQPLMHLFRLPGEAALPVLLSCVRKDGIFLFVNEQGLSMPLTASQVLTAVYLAGVLLPCLVTMLTIARETGWRNATSLVLRQAFFAFCFTLVLAWGGAWIL